MSVYEFVSSVQWAMSFGCMRDDEKLNFMIAIRAKTMKNAMIIPTIALKRSIVLKRKVFLQFS